MTLAAIEAYCLGDGRKKVETQLETLAYVWGFKKKTDDELIFFLDRMSLSLSATRTTGSVTPHENAARLKAEVVSRWSPHLSLIGEFHTHPYKNLNEVKSVSGFEFSSSYFKHLLGYDYLWETSGNTPVLLAMTICHLDRVHETIGGSWPRNSIWHYDVGEFRFWLNASVGYLVDGKRKITPNTHSKVHLDLNTRFFNETGDRIKIDKD